MTSPFAARIDEPLSLPSPAPPPRPARWPLFAALVPVVGGVAMWFVTGSLLSLCFAALGPLMAVAAAVDARRSSRRERRRADAAYAEACARIEREIEQRHDRERVELNRRLVDLGALLADERAVWRAPSDELVVGRGEASSRVRVSGGEGERADALRRRAGVLPDAPITIAPGEGVCVRGAPVVAQAVARALALQVCLRMAPEVLGVAAAPPGEEWMEALPHRQTSAPSRRLALSGEGPPPDADIVIAVRAPDAAPPEACGAVLDVGEDLQGRLIRGTHEEDVALEAVSRAQAQAVAEGLAGRGAERGGRGGPDAALTLGELEPVASGDRAGLPAVVGRADGEPAVIDIVADGPHAVVVGTTGAGKSELLVTWVASLARTYTADRVVFLLADFKGGTAFDALSELPHVTGVITDLDGAASRRAVESLRAEVRRRESRLAACGARDVGAPGVGLPRLVIVVDEFAAMLQEHPDLHAVFADVAARGRALGMHLILGTQRSTGVLRDALVANCPLRIALRVAEPSESRGVIGADLAAMLPGGVDGRGLAYIRRAADAAPRLTRIALTTPRELAPIGAEGAPRAPGPWLPPLPSELPLAAVRGREPDASAVVLGIADDPERQRQPVVTLRPRVERGLVVVGGSGSGTSNVVRLVRAQRPDAIVVPRDAEGAWDAVERAEHAVDGLLLIDDLDALLARFPHDYAHAIAERIENVVRDAGERRMTVIATTARVTGAVARIIDLLPRRALLALASRADHAAAGGDATTFDPRRPPGRGVLDGQEVQFALAPGAARDDAEPATHVAWRPSAPVTALVVKAARRRCAALADGWGDGVRILALDELPPGSSLESLAGADAPVVVAGEPESWQRQWALLQEARGGHPLVVGAECATELRALTGERELPPFARTRASRAWLCADGLAPRRIVLP